MARWNPKEAEGKALLRRTEIAKEAARLDEEATSLKSSTCTESRDVDAAEISVKVDAHYAGRSVALL
jgi:hypothetical protein